MPKLMEEELTDLGRRLETELDVTLLSARIRMAMLRLSGIDTKKRIQAGPDALKVNGYL